MSKTLKNTLLSFIGILFIAITMCAYVLLAFAKTPASNIAIGFVLLAEFALFGFIIGMGFMPQGPNNAFLRSGMVSGLSLYFAGTVILLLFSYIFSSNINVLWYLELIALAVTLIVVLAIVLFSSKINSGDQKILLDRRLVQICKKRISDLLSIHKNKPYELQLVQVLEKLKYCDEVGSASVDEKIVGAIMKLEKELGLEDAKADSIFAELNALLVQRGTEIADSKKGGF